jgi:hypothetical protein
LKISEFSLIDDEVRVFRINIKLLSNPVAELKIHENHSHCRSIFLKTMDRSIVKQLEKEKNSDFNVENFVVMLIYWGTIIITNVYTSTLNVRSKLSAHGKVYSLQLYVMNFVSDLRYVGGFLRVLMFPPPIKLTATI